MSDTTVPGTAPPSARRRRGSAVATTVAVFGVLAGLAGIEHGIGEILQGDVAPSGTVIMSWPGPGPFAVLGGEPAMTVVPSLSASGLLAVVVSACFLLVAVTPLARRRGGGPALIGLSVVMLLVGAGFGPPLLGIVVGTAASRIGAPPHGWVPEGVRARLAAAWPWCLALALVVWPALLPGTVLVALFAGADAAASVVTASVVAGLTASAFALLLLSFVTAAARDGRAAGVAARRRPAGPVPRARQTGTNGPGVADERDPTVDAGRAGEARRAAVIARQGDRIVVESVHLDAGRRSGEVLEVLGDGETRHYRVRWQDGHESVYFPGPDARVADRR